MRLIWYSVVCTFCLLSIVVLAGCVIDSSDDTKLESVYLVDRSNVGDHRSAVQAGTVEPIALAVQFESAMRFPVGGAYTVYFCDRHNVNISFGGLNLWHLTTSLDGANHYTKLHYIVFLNVHSNLKFTSETESFDLRYDRSDICLYIQETGSYFPRRSNVVKVPRALIDQAVKGDVKTLPSITTRGYL